MTTLGVQELKPSIKQTHQAGDLASTLEQQSDAEMITLRVPRELAGLLQELMPRVANGEAISFVSAPKDVTTSTAATMLGMSRPTLMKLIKAGHIPSHKVGTHTRLTSSDVHTYRQQLLGERRAAYERLLQMDEEAGITE